MHEPQSLLVGFGEVDITPSPRNPANPAFRVFDSIGFRALVLRREGESFAMLTGDFFSFETQLLEGVRALLSDIDWLNPAHIVASVSHCGGVPILFPSYVSQPCAELRMFGQEDRFIAAAAEAIRKAVQGLRPAEVGFGQRTTPQLNYNRRSYDEDGRLVMSNFMFPYPRPELTYGPIDPTVYVLRVDEPHQAGAQRQLRAAALAFGCHALCNNDKLGHISADYPGVARAIIAEATGGEVAFAPGSIGNAVPAERSGDAYKHIGEGIGRAALCALEQTATLSAPDFGVRQKTIRVPRIADDEMSADWVSEPDRVAGHDGKHRFNIYHGDSATEIDQAYTLTAVRLGDGLLLHLPGEIFVETAMAIRQSSPAASIMILSGPSADVGYLCPAKAHEEGGMEPQYAALTGEAEAMIREAAIELVAEMSMVEMH